MLQFCCFLVFRGKTKCKIMNRRRITLICSILMGCLACLAQNVVEVKKPGTLDSLLTHEQQDTCTSLVIEGNLSSADIRVLRRMAGYLEEGYHSGRLKWIDMRKAKFITDKEPYLELNADEEHLMAIARPESKSESPRLSEEYYQIYNPGRDGEVKSYPLSRNLYYNAHFILNAEEEGTRPSIEPVYMGQKQKYPAFVGADKEPPSFIGADFTKKFSKRNRRKVKSSNMLKNSGHKLEYKDNHYVWKISLKKDVFTQDMFYKCPTLEAIVLPEGINLSNLVEVRGNRIKYYITG